MSASEARAMLAYFTESADGEKLMDGGGKVWVKRGDAWFHLQGKRLFRVGAVAMAKTLCPDLAADMEAVLA